MRKDGRFAMDADAVGQLGQRAHTVEATVVVEAERVDEERANTGAPCSDHVDTRCVPHVPDAVGRQFQDVERQPEDAGVGLHDTDGARIDHARHGDTEPRADLEHLELA